MSEQNTEPQQQGCSLANGVGCLTIPAGIWLGIHFGYQWRGIVGGAGGAVAGAIAGVIAIPIFVLALFAVAALGHFASAVVERLSRKAG
jgi:uncharacterized membrane protein